jgi:repressor of nif and glnA expression
MFDIEVIGIKFTSRNQYGDFYWMCSQNKYNGSLFIFNDNEEYHKTNKRGAGNAIMRIFNKYAQLEIPLSAGIPTGTLREGGYKKFTPEIKKVIDDSIDEIIELIEIFKYKTIYFSAELDGKLGISIFAVNPKVINYITNRIYKLSSNPVKIIKLLSNDNFEDEYEDEDNEFDIDTNL